MDRRDFLRQASMAAAGLAVPCLHKPCRFDERPVGDIVFRFATASDGHYGGTAYDDTRHADLARWLRQEKEVAGLDVFIHLGDMGHHRPPVYKQEIHAVQRILLKPLAMDVFAARGNHDYLSDAEWEKEFGYPPNHAFERGDCGFIIGSSTDGRNGTVQCPGADATQWLSDRLARFSKKKYVFYFSHVFPYRDLRGGQITVACPEVTALLHGSRNVIASYHGHMHLTDYVFAKKACGRELHYCFHGRFGWTWGTLYRGYRITEIYRDGTVYTYQYNPKSGEAVNAAILG
jgi:hypothetical protein